MAAFHEFKLEDGTKMTINLTEIKYLLPGATDDGCELQTKDGQEWVLAETYKAVKKVLQK